MKIAIAHGISNKPKNSLEDWRKNEYTKYIKREKKCNCGVRG